MNTKHSDTNELPNLDHLRQEIDRIDSELVPLFLSRMKVSAEVAAWKLQNGKPVTDRSRERALLTRVTDASGEAFEQYTRVLYETILGLSRTYQHRLLMSGRPSEAKDLFLHAREHSPELFAERAKVACQGVEGAYSQIAAERLFRQPEITFYSSFGDVFRAIAEGNCRYGVLPIENSTVGSVRQVYDLMAEHPSFIVRSVRVKVDHCLLALPGTRIEDVREVLSHEQAIGQSDGFLTSLANSNPGLKVTAVPNTALASEMLASSGKRDTAVLSSRRCAELYGLEILAEGVQDAGNNHTRFICISRDPEIYPGADRTSLILGTGNRPGALYRILSRFAALDVNLIKLESRPIPERDFEFLFYFELEVPSRSDKLPALLSELEAECESFRYLGSYSEVI